MGLSEKSRCQQGYFSSGESRGRSVFLIFFRLSRYSHLLVFCPLPPSPKPPRALVLLTLPALWFSLSLWFSLIKTIYLFIFYCCCSKPFDYIEPTYIIQDNLSPCLKVRNWQSLILSSTLSLTCNLTDSRDQDLDVFEGSRRHFAYLINH